MVRLLWTSLAFWATILGTVYGTPRPLYTGFLEARGVEALGGNPANLGLPGNPFLSLSLSEVRVGFWNSALSTGLYNKYNGRYLTQEDKDELLDRLRGGWRWVGEVSLLPPLFSFTVGRFGCGTFVDAGTSVSLPRAPFELLLNGLRPGDRLDLTDMEARSYILSGVRLAYAYVWDLRWEPLRRWGFRKVSTGVGLKYITGWAYAHAEVPEGELVMGEYYAWGKGRGLIRTAGVDTAKFELGPSGRGFAFDLGMAAEGSKVSVGLALKNLGGRIGWRKAKVWEFSFEMDSLNVAKIDTMEEAVTYSDTSCSASGFSTSYPSYLVLGVSYKLELFREPEPSQAEATPDTTRPDTTSSDSLLSPGRAPLRPLPLEISLTYRQGFSEGFGVSERPEFIFGAEADLLDGRLPIFLRLCLGGGDGVVWIPGFGVRLGPLRFSAAYASRGHPFPLRGRGLELAMRLGMNI
ncbi:MAG: hypothetical protein DRP94_02560 [Candidatus Latescibacterota bacterium]|nr:MAG: hypothetical protein DRP94_02560 [Candidatus Latescibacterota bacterium]